MWAPLPPEIANRLTNSVPPQGTLSWEQALREIEEYRALTDDYDGQGAKAPPPETINAAVGLARVLVSKGVVRPSWIVPGPNGSVDLGWEYEGNVSVSIEVIEPEEADVFLFLPGQQVQH